MSITTRAAAATATITLTVMPVAAQAATAGQAARVTTKCRRARGWKATVNGRTVKATSPRLRPPNSFPRHPTFQVQFNKLPSERCPVLPGG